MISGTSMSDADIALNQMREGSGLAYPSNRPILAWEAGGCVDTYVKE